MKFIPDNKLNNALIWIIDILESNKIPYLISGGFAAHLYGCFREVNDIDIDIPNKYIPLIVPFIKDYITYGPERYVDDKWDLNLITLSYNEQEIDISGIETTHINHNGIWVPLKYKLKNPTILIYYGIELTVIDPHELIEYKSWLNGEHQIVDIDAISRYITGE